MFSGTKTITADTSIIYHTTGTADSSYHFIDSVTHHTIPISNIPITIIEGGNSIFYVTNLLYGAWVTAGWWDTSNRKMDTLAYDHFDTAKNCKVYNMQLDGANSMSTFNGAIIATLYYNPGTTACILTYSCNTGSGQGHSSYTISLTGNRM